MERKVYGFLFKDWLGRAAPYAFKLDHILFVVIGLALALLLAVLLRKKNKKVVKAWLIALWAFGSAVVAFYYVSIITITIVRPDLLTFDIETMLPLHSCLMFIYIFPFAMFSKNKVIKTAASSWLVVVNMIMGFITLFVGCRPKGSSALSFVAAFRKRKIPRGTIEGGNQNLWLKESRQNDWF